jgi:predicted RND superfamily exporter protein
MKNKKGIIILIIISVIGIGGFYLYDYIKRKLAIIKEREKFTAEEKADAEMRDKYDEISNADDFIKAVKYARYKSPWGYDISKLESKKAIIQKYSLDNLNKLKNTIYLGLGNNDSESENDLLLFLQKLYA